MSLQSPDLLQWLSRATTEAQRGNLEASRDAIKKIRETYAIERMPDVSAEVMVAEGVCEAYSGCLDAAYDRFRRAALVAHHYGSQPIEQLALSWLAHCEFNRGHPLESVKQIGLAHRDISNARPDARFRISSTVAILCEYAGMTEAATQWFTLARREASACKEPAMMSSIVYNMATLRIGSKMIARLMEKKDSRSTNIELLMVESSLNYDLISGVDIQSDMHGLLRSQALIVCEKFSEAKNILESLLLNPSDMAPVDLSRARLSHAWCQYNIHNSAEDITQQQLIECLNGLSDSDDLAFGHDVISRIAAANNNLQTAEHQQILSNRYLREFSSVRRSIMGGLVNQGLHVVPTSWNG